jgi:hypothetical protein
MNQPEPLPAYMEIANLEHRLAFFRDKRETFLKQGRVVKRAAWITLAIAAVLIPYLALTTTEDPVPALVIASILIAAVAIGLWMNRNSTWVIAPGELPGRNRFNFYPVFVEETIEQCERRLEELKSQQATAGENAAR